MSEAGRGKIVGWRKVVLVVLALAPIGVLVWSMIFMQQNEAAFDEARCPYEEVEVRVVDEAISVREERRLCQPHVEEHRWVLLRDGEEPENIGLRRLDTELYADYRWTAEVRDDGRVRLEILNGDLDPRVFNEPADEDAGR